jgi:hypothetical protein
MTSPLRPSLITAIYLNSRGFGFALFEKPTAPLDWGTVEVRGKDKREKLLARVDAVFARYRPDVVVLPDTSERGTHRPHRIRRLNDTIAVRAESYGFPVRHFSRNDVRRCFAYLQTVSKDTIAAAIAERIPALGRFLPPPRKLWKSEDARMGIFDAVALALTFFYSDGRNG